jgi:uncharacterized protein (TIGR02600 family)
MSHPISPQQAPRPRQADGFALVIVLVILVLVTTLTVGFLSTVTTETVSSKSAANANGVRGLADMAGQIVMGQIRQATTGTNSSGNTLAWASQPGMIRTYDTTGAPAAYYKLYSSDAMVVTNITSDLPTTADVQAYPACYTDLNAPVTAAGGTNQFPIIDPSAMTNGIQGFYTNATAPGYLGGTNYSSTNNPLAMPVRWIYVLKDGTMVVPTPASNPVIAGATATNPITARIAFWTDDETCKVNINTAAEGTYWDTPRFQYGIWVGNTLSNKWCVQTDPASQSTILTYPDIAFAAYQPTRYEFQRYPGHPAQVALSTVFTNVTPGNATNITPRIVWGGSKAGTFYATNAISLTNTPRYPLYASVDEFLFGANTTLRTNGSIGNTPMTKAQLEASKFFITTTSRAPETTLFNTPRIACWPVDASLATGVTTGTTSYTNRTTPYDRLIAFACSTTTTNTNPAASYLPYYFQRTNALDPTNDFANIKRNRDLYSYLQALTSSNIPGFGGNFLAKYPVPSGTSQPSDRDQILTEIFDYIRCINLMDPNLPGYPITNAAPAGNTGNWPRTTNQFSQGYRQPGGDTAAISGRGQVLPIRITTNGATTVGFGRFPSLQELGLIVICTADGSMPTNAIQFLTNYFTNDVGLFNTGLGANAAKLKRDAQFNAYSNAFVAATANCTNLTTNQIIAFISNMAQSNSLGISTNAADYLPSTSWIITNSTYGPPMWSNVLSFWANQWLPQVTNSFYGSGSLATNSVVTTNEFGELTTNQVVTGKNTVFLGMTGGRSYTNYSNVTLGGTPLTWKQKRFQMFFIPSLHYATAGMSTYGADLVLGLNGLANVSVANAINIMNGSLFPSGRPTAPGGLLKVNYGWLRPYTDPIGTDLMQTSLRMDSAYNSSWKTNTLISGAAPNNKYPYYPWISQPFTIDTNSASTINLGASTLTFSIYQGRNAYDGNESDLSPNFIETTAPKLADLTNSASNNLAQTATLVFPAVSLPLPSLPTWDTRTNAYTNSSYFWQLEDRFLNTFSGIFPTYGNNDVIRSMAFNGDQRIAALMTNIPSSFFTTNANYASTTLLAASNRLVNTVPACVGNTINGINTLSGSVPPGTVATTGDFDMIARVGPSAFIHKPDEGSRADFGTNNWPDYFFYPTATTNQAYYTPNRIMPSPGMFGSLPTGVQKAISRNGTSPNNPGNWQTLLFRPQPGHPGAGVPAVTTSSNSYTTPPDHLIMDLFWMPIVEPYAISEAFSTDGKINMNYQIQPFTNIIRETALLAAMKNKMMAAVPNGVTDYGYDTGTANYLTSPNWNNSTCWRKTLNLSDTNGALVQFQQRFAAGDIFRSATEICDIYLPPRGTNWTDGWTGSQAAAFWTNNLNTPENVREKSYTDLYAHLTTKSNVYMVHFRVQTLKQSPASTVGTWREGIDQVTGEYRGSSLIERYLDASDTTLPDFATNPAKNINNWYKFRVISTKKFAP